jgi:hypothetical protein
MGPIVAPKVATTAITAQNGPAVAKTTAKITAANTPYASHCHHFMLFFKQAAKQFGLNDNNNSSRSKIRLLKISGCGVAVTNMAEGKADAPSNRLKALRINMPGKDRHSSSMWPPIFRNYANVFF